MIGLLTVLFGILRDALFIPLTGLKGTIARIILVPIEIAYVILLSYLFFRKIEIYYDQQDLWLIGFIWLVLTILFEFSFGFFIIGHSVETLLKDYIIFIGRVWPIIFITVFLAPLMVNKFIIDNTKE